MCLLVSINGFINILVLEKGPQNIMVLSSGPQDVLIFKSSAKCIGFNKCTKYMFTFLLLSKIYRYFVIVLTRRRQMYRFWWRNQKCFGFSEETPNVIVLVSSPPKNSFREGPPSIFRSSER